MNDPQLAYTASPARYAKGMIAVHCTPDGTGWKTVAASIISLFHGARYSNREHSYILSPTKFKRFEAEIEAARVERERVRKEDAAS